LPGRALIRLMIGAGHMQAMAAACMKRPARSVGAP
jgi:hypothetical protein